MRGALPGRSQEMSLLSPVTVAAPAAACGSWVPLAAFWFSGLFPGPSPTTSFLQCCCPMLPALCLFLGLPRPCYSSFSASSFLLTHYSQDFLPRLVGEGELRRRAEKAFALLPPFTSPLLAENLLLPAFAPYHNIPLQ